MTVCIVRSKIQTNLFITQIEIDKIIQSFENKEFSYDKFGTIAHAFAESIFTNEEPKIPSHLTQMLSEKQKEIVEEDFELL